MKPNIVFLDEYTLGGADLTRLHELGRYTGYSTTAPDEVADRCRDAEIVITHILQHLQLIPQLNCSGVSILILLTAPRSLNAPVICMHSAFRYT